MELHGEAEQRLRQMLAQEPPALARGAVEEYVRAAFEKGARLLERVRGRALPLWALEPTVLAQRARRFRAAFEAVLPDTGVFYAMKSNNHPEVSAALARAGIGLDVSSGVELRVALDTAAREIVFSGPGKTDVELAQAAAHAGRVVVLMDSFAELERLDAAARRAGVTVRAGVRITPPPPNRWRKFGVPLSRLGAFFDKARACEAVDLRGIQFHSSWNLGPDAQVAVIRALGETIAAWPAERLERIEFLDIGGGFWPEPGEWLLPSATERGRLLDMLGMPPEAAAARPAAYATQPIEEFARALSGALREHILSRAACRVCFEPGRWLCNDAMHLLLTVVDKKAEDLVVTDAGTNAIGWERYESDYCPVLNLTRPALTERRCEIVGSLCTPHDFWGFSYWGEGIEPGDVLMIPNQGAYTWSLRQEFIKPLPGVAVVEMND